MTPAALEAWSREAFRDACLDELRAPKPGNVHDFAAGHRMTVADFERSAEAAAPHLTRTGAPVGERVRGAMLATMAAVGCNTNLGILLLAAPLAVAAERLGGPADASRLQAELAVVLDGTTVADATAVFDAIVTANPGGLGDAPEHDVSGPAKVTLKAAMGAAADRDTIARQYVTTFADLFERGIPAYGAAISRGRNGPRATLAVYFAFASGLRDAHVERKFGVAVAEAVRREFRELSPVAEEFDLPALVEFDRELKARGINPGTSADLTVATLYLARLTGVRTKT